MSSITNPVMDAIVGFFTEDPWAFDSEDFWRRIASNADYATTGRAALAFLEDKLEPFADAMSAPHSRDEWGFTELLQNILRDFPAEWVTPFGEALDGALAQYARKN
jgi:hypothetical protein